MPGENGTPEALRDLAEQVLVWVAREKQRGAAGTSDVDEDDVRRIELCAQAVIEVDMFVKLYTSNDHDEGFA